MTTTLEDHHKTKSPDPVPTGRFALLDCRTTPAVPPFYITPVLSDHTTTPLNNHYSGHRGHHWVNPAAFISRAVRTDFDSLTLALAHARSLTDDPSLPEGLTTLHTDGGSPPHYLTLLRAPFWDNDNPALKDPRSDRLTVLLSLTRRFTSVPFHTNNSILHCQLPPGHLWATKDDEKTGLPRLRHDPALLTRQKNKAAEELAARHRSGDVSLSDLKDPKGHSLYSRIETDLSSLLAKLHPGILSSNHCDTPLSFDFRSHSPTRTRSGVWGHAGVRESECIPNYLRHLADCYDVAHHFRLLKKLSRSYTKSDFSKVRPFLKALASWTPDYKPRYSSEDPPIQHLEHPNIHARKAGLLLLTLIRHARKD